MQKRHPLHFIYYLCDFLITLFFVLLSFLSFEWKEIVAKTITSSQIIGISIYSVCISLITVGVFCIFKVYKTLTRDFGLTSAIKIALITLGIHLFGLIFLLAIPDTYLPKMFGCWLMSTVILMFAVPSLRLSSRLFRLLNRQGHKSKRVRTMIIGAGASAKVAYDETNSNVNNNQRIVVFLDDDKSKINRVYGNVPVKGPISNAKQIIEKYKVEEVIIAISNLDKERLHEILDLLKDSNVRIKRMPLLSEMDGPNDLHVMDVNLDELLNREVTILENIDVKNQIEGKTVLVTGAGGSIGSELCRQIFNMHPNNLILFDIYENSTYEIEQELKQRIRKENIKNIKLYTFIGSTYNLDRSELLFKKFNIDYIYHAAAYKHVPLMEDSPMEAIRTNVIGTYNIALLADKYKVKKMVLVSTDKAVRPTNTMGATKAFAEKIISHFSNISKNTVYASVRFGNVLGSNGSVVPLFIKQIQSGGPITLTSKEIIRYFMTIPEAVSLILECGLYASKGEIFILDMGNPVKIHDLAINLIRQAGLVPYKDIEIVETGLRPGEKMYEELLLDTSRQEKTPNKKIYIDKNEDSNNLEEEIKYISKAFSLEDNKDIKLLLKEIIKDYTPDI